MWRYPFLFIVFCGLASVALKGQPDYRTTQEFALPPQTMSLQRALEALTASGALISYRPDQLPEITVVVTGVQRSLSDWLTLLLRETELTYRLGPAGYLIVSDYELRDRRFTLSGMVKDAVSGERLIGAAVQEVESQSGALANEYGFYSLITKGGRKKINVSYTGYASREVTFVLRSDTVLHLNLQASGLLPEVEVKASYADSISQLYLLESERRMDPAEVSRINGPGGEASILSLARLLPGVTSGADGVGGLSIRGSNSGHNLVLFDGVPVYNVNHAAGLFSIFNTTTIRRADLYKDGFPARFGGRIGGVMDVHTRDGNLYFPEITLGSSLLSATVTAEGPLRKGESSFLVSGRYFWGGDILRSLSESQKRKLGRAGSIQYAVNDLNFKLNQQVGKQGRLYFSLYRGLDDFGNFGRQQDSVTVLTPGGAVLKYVATQQREELINWGNTVGALRYNHVFNDRFFGNFRLSYSDLLVKASFERSDSLYESNNNRLTSDISSGRFGTAIKQVGAAFDGQINLNRLADLRFGTSLDLHRFLPQIRSGRVPLSNHPVLGVLSEAEILESAQLAAYTSFDGAWRGLRYRLGFRAQVWRNELNYYHLSPRLLLAGKVGLRGEWRLTYDKLVQPIHLVSSTVIGLPTDLWVPSTPEIRPSTSRQISWHYAQKIADRWSVEFGLYHRGLRNLVDYTESGDNNGWLENLSVGNGYANGIEATISRSSQRFGGWLSYTLANSRRQFDEKINLGRPFPFQYDRRHQVKLLATLNISRQVNVTATWRYESGAAYSLSLENFLLADPSILDPDDGDPTPLVRDKNGFRLPANHRLDVNATFSLTKNTRRNFRHILNLGIYNLYSRHNPIFYDLRTSFFSRRSELIKDQQFVQIYFGGIQPTLAYQLAFSAKRK